MSSRRRASRPDRAEGRRPRQGETFAQAHPRLAEWVRGSGRIEWGDDLFPLERRSCIRALDGGGLIWAGKETYPTANAALRDLGAALGRRMREHFGARRRGATLTLLPRALELAPQSKPRSAAGHGPVHRWPWRGAPFGPHQG